ncbi:MAG TPA: alpha/beta fold hydrolase [Caulobacteraceae bacterium]|nr:alpha/beta fold hydrolase [Caulobacteraceae bacterium]
MKLAAAAVATALALAGGAGAQPASPVPDPVWRPAEGDYVIRDFRFASGEELPSLRLHWLTLGTPRRDGAGHVVNAVLILHGTGGSGRQFLQPQFAGELFGPGQLLDTRRWYIILPDDIGHGKSSKPSDGLKAKFPHYGYGDMVRAEHALVADGLGVDHLRLIMGTSMGCMHAFLWGERWPQMMDALMPLACLPVAIAGRNRVWRDMIVRAIRTDPGYRGGDYTAQPAAGLQTAADILAIAGSAPAQMQKMLPTPAAADAWLEVFLGRVVPSLDANDLIYQVESSRDYDPAPQLGAIRARVMWINSADDFINPPELGIAQREATKLENGRFVLLPISDLTHGHGTHTWAAAWKPYLADVLAESEAPAR